MITPPLKSLLVVLAAGTLSSFPARSAVLYYADDLLNKQTLNGANGTVSGTDASSVISLTSARNGSVTYSFSSISLANTGDSLTSTFSFFFNQALSPVTSSPAIEFRLGNSATGYYTSVSFLVVGGSNSATPATSLTTNLGKFNSAAISTSSASSSNFTFTLTKTDTGAGLSLTFDGTLLTSGSVTRDVGTTPTSTSFDQITFRFAGGSSNAGEDWRAPITTTINNFSIASPIPEPASHLLLGSAGFALLIIRAKMSRSARKTGTKLGAKTV